MAEFITQQQLDDLFDAINRQSSYVVAVDPGFANVRPRSGTYAFTEQTPQIQVLEPAPGTHALMTLRPADGAELVVIV